MDEQDIPIDINTNKLLDWLINRRHVNKNWQNNILKIREKINNAIQDMPAHDGILKLLSGQHINYFHCMKIVEILKETEADTKNLFGGYGSRRMKDWKDIVSSYQKENLYLAEAAQMLIRIVTYEIPSVRKQISKLKQNQMDCEKQIKDYSKKETIASKDFCGYCEQLGISGHNIKNELIELLKLLPNLYEEIAEKIKIVKPAVELYIEFNKYLSGKQSINMLGTLQYLVEYGNTTTYQFKYGQKPAEIEYGTFVSRTESENSNDIDFGENIDIDFGDNSEEIYFNNDTDDGGIAVMKDEPNGNSSSSNPEEEYEIISHDDINTKFEESGIVVEKSGNEAGVARGVEGLSILDNPKTQEHIINDLMELSTFLNMRLFEMSNELNLLDMSQMQDTPANLQMQTIESITALNDCVNVALSQLMNKKIQHLHNIKHSPKYVDILTETLKQKQSLVEKMKSNKIILDKKIRLLNEDIKNMEPLIKILAESCSQLQKDIEEDISKKYKGRNVNLIGVISIL